jgi:hypothetical protein
VKDGITPENIVISLEEMKMPSATTHNAGTPALTGEKSLQGSSKVADLLEQLRHVPNEGAGTGMKALGAIGELGRIARSLPENDRALQTEIVSSIVNAMFSPVARVKWAAICEVADQIPSSMLTKDQLSTIKDFILDARFDLDIEGAHRLVEKLAHNKGIDVQDWCPEGQFSFRSNSVYFAACDAKDGKPVQPKEHYVKFVTDDRNIAELDAQLAKLSELAQRPFSSQPEIPSTPVYAWIRAPRGYVQDGEGFLTTISGSPDGFGNGGVKRLMVTESPEGSKIVLLNESWSRGHPEKIDRIIAEATGPEAALLFGVVKSKV